jgi:hypothetical protein
VRFFTPFEKVELIHGISSKAPTQTQKFKALQKLILSFFSNITHIISQLTDEDTLHLAITESAKLVPYIINSRKAVKSYLKVSTLFTVFSKILVVLKACSRNASICGQVGAIA